MKKHNTTFGAALLALTLLAAVALAAGPEAGFYDNDESAITQLRDYGIAAFQDDHSIPDHQAYLSLQQETDLELARFEWDTQLTGLNCIKAANYQALQNEGDLVLDSLAAE